MWKQNERKGHVCWALLLAMSIGSLYTSVGVFGIAVSLLLLFCNYRKCCSSNSEKILLLVILYLPFYTLFRLTLIEIGLKTVSSIFNYLRDFLILILLFSMYLRDRKMHIKRNDAIWVMFFINWILGLLLSVLNGYGVLGVSGLHLTVLPMLLYLIIAYDKKIQIDADVITDIFIKIAFVCAITGLVFYYSRPDYYKILFSLAGNEVNAGDYIRFVSVFFTPNVCGCFFSIALIVSLVKLLNRKKLSYALFVAIFGWCIIMTLSRGAWLFTIIAILLYIILLKPKIGFILGMPVLLVLIYGEVTNWSFAVFDTFMGNIVKERFLSLFDSSNTSSYGRLENWTEALVLLKQSPLGYGMGVGTTAQISRGIETSVKVIDGFYMKTFAETGVVGMFYVVGLVTWLIAKFYVLCKKRATEVSYIAFLVACGYLCQSVGSNPFDFVCTAPFLWILLGLAEAQNRIRSVE